MSGGIPRALAFGAVVLALGIFVVVIRKHSTHLSTTHQQLEATLAASRIGQDRQQETWRGLLQEIKTDSTRLLVLTSGLVLVLAGALLAWSAIGGTRLRRQLRERERALQSLRMDQSRLRAATEGTTDAIFVKDRQGRYLLMNTPGANLLGKSVTEVIGKDDTGLFPSEQARQIMEVDRWVMLAGEAKTSEEAWTVQGMNRTYLTTKGPYCDQDGNIIGLVGIARDITKRKQAEEALSDLYDNAPDLFGSVDAASSRMLQCNRTFTTVTGFSKEEIVGRSILEIHSGDCAEAVERALETFLAAGDVRNAELQLRRKDGRKLEVSLNVSAVRDEQGRIRYGRCVWRDITERRQAEKRLRQLSGRLLRLQDEERRRIARELHDTTAQNLAALKMALSQVDQAADSLQGSARAAVSTSLTLADECARQIRTASYLLHPPLLDELGIGSALRAYAEGYAQRTGVRVELAVPNDIGRLATEVEMTLFRIAQEALANVHRHSGSPTAEIRVERAGGQVILQVRDQGRGLPAGTLDRGSARLGVGISGMRERARQLGGALNIDSSTQGTIVEVVLPVEGNTL